MQDELTTRLIALTEQFHREHGGQFDQVADVVTALDRCKLSWQRRVMPHDDEVERNDAALQHSMPHPE